MSNSLSAINDGIDFQARLFWIKACDLLNPKSSVAHVKYERGPKGFDDISVLYDPPMYMAGRHIECEHFQCKWHVRPGSFTGADLCLPSFTNAKSISFLEVARDVYRDNSTTNSYQVHLATNWTVDSKDTLSSVFRSSDGRIDVEKLFDGSGPRSNKGKLRKLWLDRLGVDEDELREIVSRVVILGLPFTLDAIDVWLDAALALAGLISAHDCTSVRRYDDLARKLLSQKRVEFGPEEFRTLCMDEQLVAPPPTSATGSPWTLGIRSFMHKFDNMDNRCDDVLDLIEHFDGRYPRSPSTWNDALLPELDGFLVKHASQHDELRLVLDAHTSLAFAAGSVLDTKAGKTIWIEQRFGSKRYWSFDDTQGDVVDPMFDVAIDHDSEDAGDIFCGVGITHDLVSDVNGYVDAIASKKGARLLATISSGVSNSAVRSGAHAWQLSEELVRQLRLLGAGPGGPHVHLFIAAPNTFTFFLGQHSRALGPVTIYEFDFDGQRGGGYSPGLVTDIQNENERSIH